MPITLAFDVYGTLIDTNAITIALEKYLGAKAKDFAKHWREKQLEYSFRRGLMQNYKDFAQCTKEALDYTLLVYKLMLKNKDKAELMDVYSTLPVFQDVKDGLDKLKDKGCFIYAFSNGHDKAIEKLLKHANILDYFIDIISVHKLQTFKPNPKVYKYFLDRTNSKKNNTWLISSNPFDVIGALSFGMYGVWLKRLDNAIFDTWGYEPTLTLQSINELSRNIE